MDGAAPVELPRHGEPAQRPVQGIKRRGLRIGKEWRTHKNIWVPKGNSTRAQGGGRVVAVGIEVVEDVAAGQYSIRKKETVKEQQDKEGQERCGRQGQSEAAYRTEAATDQKHRKQISTGAQSLNRYLMSAAMAVNPSRQVSFLPSWNWRPL